jgi:hypothetical protein
MSHAISHDKSHQILLWSTKSHMSRYISHEPLKESPHLNYPSYHTKTATSCISRHISHDPPQLTLAATTRHEPPHLTWAAPHSHEPPHLIWAATSHMSCQISHELPNLTWAVTTHRSRPPTHMSHHISYEPINIRVKETTTGSGSGSMAQKISQMLHGKKSTGYRYR